LTQRHGAGEIGDCLLSDEVRAWAAGNWIDAYDPLADSLPVNNTCVANLQGTATSTVSSATHVFPRLPVLLGRPSSRMQPNEDGDPRFLGQYGHLHDAFSSQIGPFINRYPSWNATCGHRIINTYPRTLISGPRSLITGEEVLANTIQSPSGMPNTDAMNQIHAVRRPRIKPPFLWP
jgi:hypothetical protein